MMTSVFNQTQAQISSYIFSAPQNGLEKSTVHAGNEAAKG
jgi:hypothetical protein